MLRVAWRDVRFHPVRFAMSVLAVALGVAFVAGTFALRAMLSSTFDGIVATTVEGDVYVVADNGTPFTPAWMAYLDEQGKVPDTLVPAIDALDEVRWVYADYTGPVLLVGADGTRVSSGQAPSMAWIVDDEAIITDQGFKVTGEVPRGPDQIGLESRTADKAGLKIGDTTIVIIGGQAPREVTVTGIATSGTGTPFAGAVVVGMDAATAKAAFAPTGAVPMIVVRGVDGISQDKLAAAVAAVLPPEANATVKTGDTMRTEAKESIDENLGFVSTFLMVFAVIALFVGAFIIANTFSMVVRQRLRETAVLRAVGASRRQVFTSFVTQAAIVGLIGSLLGLAGGFGLVAVIRSVFEAMGMALSGEVPVTTTGVAIPVGLGVAVAMVAAALPARRASRTAPVEAMRPGSDDSQRGATVRGSIGAAMTLAGIGCLVAAHRAAEDGGPALGAGAGLILLGLIVAAPALAPAVTWVLAVPVAAVSKPFGTLAQRNLARNRRRTASTASALMIVMALVGATTVLASSVRASVADLIDAQLDSDFVIDGSASMAGVPAAALDDLAKVDGALVMMVSVTTAVVTPDGSDPKVVELGVMHPEAMTRGFAPDLADGTREAFTDGVAVSVPIATRYGLKTGDTLEVTLAKDTPMETTAELVVQVVYRNEAISTDVLLTETTARTLLEPDVYSQVVTAVQGFVVLDPGADPDAVRAQLVDAVAGYYTISVM
ncbi:MAG: FtsX-like permease family protein, partial [Micrococcales bacterium]|nr:FtsX-like permease family protein [Micrococcales bacterium]